MLFPGDLKKISLSTKVKLLLLNFLVKIAYLRFKPEVIAVTGSMAKSTSINFIFQLLKKFNPGDVDTNLNTDSGARHRILNLKKSKTAWGYIINFFLAWKILFVRKISKFFVFEFRSQRRGRIEFASRSLKPKIGVFMWVAPAHSEYFGTLSDIYKEKSALIKSLPKSGCAILNYDDQRVRKAHELTKAKILFFGLNPKADLWASGITSGLEGLKAKIHYQDKSYNLCAENIINHHHIYPLLSAISVLLSLGYPIEKIISAARNLQPMSQRSSIESGIKESLLINETFNANPKSATGALEMLSNVSKGRRRIAVIGDMLEQGAYRVSGHKEVGKVAAKNVDELILIGKDSNIIGQSARENGLDKSKIHWFSDSVKAGEFLKKIIQKNDIVLFKGSNAMKLDVTLNAVKK